MNFEMFAVCLFIAGILLYLFSTISLHRPERKKEHDKQLSPIEEDYDDYSYDEIDEETTSDSISTRYSGLKIENIDFSQKRLYTKLCSIFDEVTSGKAKIADYYILDYDRTKKECRIVVEFLRKDMISMILYSENNDDCVSLDSPKQYVYFHLDHAKKEANVMCLKDNTYYSEQIPENIYRQHILNSTADVFTAKLKAEDIYLQQYVTEDNTVIWGKNQPELHPRKNFFTDDLDMDQFQYFPTDESTECEIKTPDATNSQNTEKSSTKNRK